MQALWHGQSEDGGKRHLSKLQDDPSGEYRLDTSEEVLEIDGDWRRGQNVALTRDLESVQWFLKMYHLV
jgi:hypothetical protein